MHPFWADAPTLSDISMVTQSDPGTEKFGIMNAQTLLRQMHDPTLEGFVQHRWMRTKKKHQAGNCLVTTQTAVLPRLQGAS